MDISSTFWLVVAVGASVATSQPSDFSSTPFLDPASLPEPLTDPNPQRSNSVDETSAQSDSTANLVPDINPSTTTVPIPISSPFELLPEMGTTKDVNQFNVSSPFNSNGTSSDCPSAGGVVRKESQPDRTGSIATNEVMSDEDDTALDDVSLEIMTTSPMHRHYIPIDVPEMDQSWDVDTWPMIIDDDATDNSTIGEPAWQFNSTTMDQDRDDDCRMHEDPLNNTNPRNDVFVVQPITHEISGDSPSMNRTV